MALDCITTHYGDPALECPMMPIPPSRLLCRLSLRRGFVKYVRNAPVYRCWEDKPVRDFGRRAAILIALAMAPLVASNAAEAKRKKHKPAPSASAHATSKHRKILAAPGKDGPSDPKMPPSKPADKTKADAPKPHPNTWTDAEIAEAKTHCDEILKRIHAVAIAHAPIKHGACGAPAPVELLSIGENPPVSLSPAPIVRCDLAEALVTWLELDVQPSARKHLGGPIVKIETMSDYSCRNAYRRKSTRLSEHGLANAVDIGTFITASAKTASVLDDWGKSQREIVAEAAAEKKAAEMAAAEKAAQAKRAHGPAPKTPPPVATASKLGAPATGLAHAESENHTSKITVTLPGAESADLTAPETHPAAPKQTKPPPDPEVEAFLHEAHEAACHIFGTTLGPEANADHRNHFHVDMAVRKYKKICD
ncbi:extensin family protein [Hyphomicrobium sp.]|uniref:extensin-like domain-containing protein n=1 Tax=Hyphomicrobium sp. TaxID=82 RepID=UPI002C31EA62|nr:extensin family protein [Hyphomicrobium sp.]HVZ04962.1 extensin family protein [Hyphomicrobium sp.]